MPDPFDPFTSAHQAILSAFRNHAALAALVPAGNFVDTTDPLFQQFKPPPTSADTPQIKLLQADFTLPPFGGCSTSVRFTQVFRVLVCTDVLRVVPLNQVKYQMLIALVKAGPNLGLSCASGYDLSTGRDDFDSKEAAPSQRWTAAFSINVHLYLSRQQLAAS
jgi:hypothetical protein